VSLRARRDALLARPWTIAFAATALVLLVLRLVDLGGSPPGLYNDEASVGYNAWAIAHHGVDEHGAQMPLFFQAFGEYKNPVYIYTLAPFTWVLPLTPYVVRLPAALFGLAACAAAAALAWELTRSRRVTLLVLITAGVEPWLVQESRLGFEVIAMVSLLMIALWCLARAHRDDSAVWFAWAGVALALSVLAYSTGRVFGVLLIAVIAVSHLTPVVRRCIRWLWMLPSMVAVYIALLVYNANHPGALTARFDVITIAWDHPPLGTLIGRFLVNYVTYWGFPFLITHGDPNPRHNPGFGGMLLVVTVPAIVLGAAICVRRFRSDAFCRILVLGALAAPGPAAVTAETTPHSLRAALMLPFLLALSVYGWQALVQVLTTRRLVALALAAAVCVEAGGFFYDLYVQYPGRALAYFDAGEGDAVVAAARLAGPHAVYLSGSLDLPYIQALFYLRPDPNQYALQGLDVLHMRVEDAASIAADAQPGDYMVLSPGDAVPSGAHLVLAEQQTVSTGPPEVGLPDTRVVQLAVVAQR
jgi:hypothetical protein